MNGSAGTVLAPTPGSGRGAFLAGVSALDVEIAFSVASDKASSAGGQYVYGVVRRVTARDEYRAKVRFTSDGGVYVNASRLLAGVEAALSPDVRVPGLARSPGTVVRIRAQAVGTNPTSIRVRAWTAGTSEPAAWHYTATDASAALQAPGSVGLRAYLSTSTTNAPVVFTFDDYVVGRPQ